MNSAISQINNDSLNRNPSKIFYSQAEISFLLNGDDSLLIKELSIKYPKDSVLPKYFSPNTIMSILNFSIDLTLAEAYLFKISFGPSYQATCPLYFLISKRDTLPVALKNQNEFNNYFNKNSDSTLCNYDKGLLFLLLTNNICGNLVYKDRDSSKLQLSKFFKDEIFNKYYLLSKKNSDLPFILRFNILNKNNEHYVIRSNKRIITVFSILFNKSGEILKVSKKEI